MNISEIIDGLQEIQHQKLKHTNERDIQRVCELSVHLARYIAKVHEDVLSVSNSLKTHTEFGNH